MAESGNEFDVIVVGCGIGGMAAAVSALDSGARVAILERATFEERGGSTRYTGAFMRMKNEAEVSDDFVDHFVANAGGHLDPSLVDLSSRERDSWPSNLRAMSFTDPEFIATFADQAAPTIEWLKRYGIRFFPLDVPFLTASQPRMVPSGGGIALIEGLAAHFESRGGKFFYETTALSLLQGEAGDIVGVKAVAAPARTIEFRAGAVVLACGGFQGNAEMMTQYIGPRALNLRPSSRGGYYNRGEGIRMAFQVGAAPCGDFGSWHASPMDPRSGKPGPVVYIYPYGILVNQLGLRFTDEAPGTTDETYEDIARLIFAQPNGLAYTIIDRKIDAVPHQQIAIRTDQPPIVADTLAELGSRLGLPAEAFAATVEAFNAGCSGGRFVPLELDGLRTTGVVPGKSNWAQPLDSPPYKAYPIISSNVFTFGGLKVDSRARVINHSGDAIPGLYAAGEIIGTYYKSYTGATSVMKGAVFGRIAGADAALRRSRAAERASELG